MRVGFIQTNPKLLKPRENVSRALELLKRLRADLIVLPELFNTGYNFRSKKEVEKVAEAIPDGFTSQVLLAEVRRKKCAIVAGIAERANGKLYNSAVFVTPKSVKRYRKIHLFKDEKRFFAPGNLGFQVFEAFGAKIGVMICFDWFFPESCRTLAVKGAEIIAHPANLVLPYCPEGMKTRSLENRIFTITADRAGRERGLRYMGQSQVTDVRGKVLYRAGKANEEIFSVEISPREARRKKINPFNDLLGDRRMKYYR